MITPASQPSLFTGAKTETKDRTGLGREAFLTLLVAQLKNQDPLSPLQPHEFAAQLAQFSSVEQLTQLNDGLSALAQSNQVSSLVGKATLSAALLGRVVTAEGDRIVIPSSGAATLRADVGAVGGSATLRLLDDHGSEVASRSLGAIGGGHQTIVLPADLPPGTWTVVLQVEDPTGAAVPVRTYATGVVDGVYFNGSAIVLRLGELEVPLDDVAEIGTTRP